LKVVICQSHFLELFYTLEIRKVTCAFLPALSKKNVNSKGYIFPLFFPGKQAKPKNYIYFLPLFGKKH